MSSSRKCAANNDLAGVYRADREGRILFANNAMAKIFEYESPEEMVSAGATIRYRNPRVREEFIAMLTDHGKISNHVIEVLTRIGRPVSVLVSAALEGETISGMVFDITEHIKREEQLRQAQKMEAVELLAGGVAHDFNNILSTIMGHAQLALMEMQEKDPLRNHIEQILESSGSAAAITQSLLAFSRKQTVNLSVIDLNEVTKGFEKTLFGLMREDIRLETTRADRALSIMADKGQIEQVMMNLAANALDAMPGGGRLIVETGLVSLDKEFIEAHGYGREGSYALLSVSDTGTGMDVQTTSRVFEPFFTTKKQGKGTGLGLSMVYGIVKKHDGYINVYSEPGKGTTFKIYLPLIRDDAEADHTEEAVQGSLRGGTETILVADDDAALRHLTMAALNHFGYTVIQAVDGADAVSKFMENRGNIHLIVLDGIMPNMNGREAFRKIKAVNPDIKCIFMSGYAEDIFTKDGVPDREAEFILKPVSPTDFLKKVRAMLDR